MKNLLLICLLAIFQCTYTYSQDSQLIAGVYASEESSSSFESPNAAEVKGILNRFVKNYLSYNPDRFIYVGCNEQNSYYESDTVRMRKISQDYYPLWECCEFVEWNLVDDARFLWSDLQACKKGVQRSYYLSTTKIKASLQNKSIYLDIFRNGSAIERFKLLNIEKATSKNHSEADEVLVLLRLPMAQ